MVLFLPELLLTLAAGPLGIAIEINETSSKDNFLALCFLVQFRPGHSIGHRNYFAATFGAYTGFAVYDDWFHNRI